jgi:HK97 family phage major capsid protein
MLGSPVPGARFSLCRALSGMAAQHLSGFEERALRATAENFGIPYEQQNVHIPWSFFSHGMTVGAATEGGYPAGQVDVLGPRDVLHGLSTIIDAGAMVIPGLRNDAAIPIATTPPVAYVLPDEQGTATESTVKIAAAMLRQKAIGCTVDISHQLLKQAPATEPFVERLVLSAVSAKLDEQGFSGVGTDGQLAGLSTLSGVSTGTGTSFDFDEATSMLQVAAENGARDSEVAWIAPPAVRKLLQTRERDAGDGFLWENDRMADRRALASASIGTASLNCGPWPQAVLGSFCPGLEITLDPYGQFQQGIVRVRRLLSADLAVPSPGAFVKCDGDAS